MAITIEVLDHNETPERKLNSGIVQVWRASLKGTESCLTKHSTLLSSEELEQTHRYRRRQDRHRYIMSHGILRRILANSMLCADPKTLLFTKGPHGKPSLVGKQGLDNIQFNMAHSGDMMLIAISRDHTVGVDIEKIRNNVDVMSLARTFFTQGEQDLLDKAQPPEQLELFFHCWVRKEACLKAYGLGVQKLLPYIDVLNSDRIDIPDSYGPPCCLFNFETQRGFHAALGIVQS